MAFIKTKIVFFKATSACKSNMLYLESKGVISTYLLASRKGIKESYTLYNDSNARLCRL